MGNSESAENQGLGGPGKQTDEGEKHKLYRFVDMHGGGELVPWMRYAKNSGDYSIIDEFIETKVVRSIRPHLWALWIQHYLPMVRSNKCHGGIVQLK